MTIKVGDKVTWTETRERRHGFAMKTLLGKVTILHGDEVWVKSGRTVTLLPRSRVRLAGLTTELTEAVETLMQAQKA